MGISKFTSGCQWLCNQLPQPVFIFRLFVFHTLFIIQCFVPWEEVDQLVRRHSRCWCSLVEWVALNCQNTSQNVCYGCKNKNLNLIWSIFLLMDESFWGSVYMWLIQHEDIFTFQCVEILDENFIFSVQGHCSLYLYHWQVKSNNRLTIDII